MWCILYACIRTYGYIHATTQVNFRTGDFLNADLSWLEADLLFICSTCMPIEWFTPNGALGSKLSQLKRGARVCLTTHALTGVRGLRCIGCVRDLQVSWGVCIGRVYERVDDEKDDDD